MYNHRNQYRCSIIRGKSQKDIDNLLSTYALIIDEICPCEKEKFEFQFNSELARILHGKNADTIALKKTLDNHRTEIAGKLFGMYYISNDGICFAAERTKKFLADNDQPAFFKDVCYKMQFPNGMNKIQTLQPHLENKISLRQYPFIIKVLLLADEMHLILSVNDIGYYILNSLDVLQGNATPQEVLDTIKLDKECGYERKIAIPEGKASSYTMQHIREQLNYLELANLIYINNENLLILNRKEQDIIDIFAAQCGENPEFDVYSYDIDSAEQRNQLYLDWGFHFSKLSPVAGAFKTNVAALVTPESSKPSETPKAGENTVEIGDDGEQYVYEYEKRRVSAFNPRLANKVLALGKTKGLGYDIQSVIAETGEMAEFVKYIEVKATKRVTAPDPTDETWVDTINITRNEWVAAMQHKDFYSIYRVYFVRNGVVVYMLNNIYEKQKNGSIQVVPTMYRVDFSNDAIDAIME